MGCCTGAHGLTTQSRAHTSLLSVQARLLHACHDCCSLSWSYLCAVGLRLVLAWLCNSRSLFLYALGNSLAASGIHLRSILSLLGLLLFLGVGLLFLLSLHLPLSGELCSDFSSLLTGCGILALKLGLLLHLLLILGALLLKVIFLFLLDGLLFLDGSLLLNLLFGLLGGRRRLLLLNRFLFGRSNHLFTSIPQAGYPALRLVEQALAPRAHLTQIDELTITIEGQVGVEACLGQGEIIIVIQISICDRDSICKRSRCNCRHEQTSIE